MTLLPGTRVRVAAPYPSALPWTMVGSLAEVVRVNPASVMLRLLAPQHADRALRYVPSQALGCLVAVEGER